MAKEIKLPPKGSVREQPKPKMHFAFQRENYVMLLIGILLMVIGYILLSGGGSSDPNIFNYDLFSPRRMVIAPLILLAAYILVAVAIFKTPKQEDKELKM